MKNILFLNKYILGTIPFIIPIIFIFYGLINNGLINIFPIKPFIITPNNIIINHGGEKYELTPVKKFGINGKLVSKKDYSQILEKEETIISEDWLFVFGKIAKSEYLNNLEITQADRSFAYDYKINLDVNRAYVLSHMINVNILTDNNKISTKLGELSTGSELKLFGYLVNIELIESDSYFKQNTSKVLTDSGYGSSEILYVTEIEINGKTIK